ncbi:MAG: RsmE family RNA methyltransferase [Pseudomonadota bacterium]
MPQFFIGENISEGTEIILKGPEAHHIINVLRLKTGDWIALSDGKGRSYNSRIMDVRRKELTVTIEDERPTIDTSNLPTLAIAITKHDKLELIIQKAVELGTPKIVTFKSERTVPKFSQSATSKKLERWNSIALSAAIQSGLPLKPVVYPPIEFHHLCEQLGSYHSKFIFWEGETENTLDRAFTKDTAKPLIIIGPEGGFAQDEVKMARSQGAISVSLGPQILRVETAAIAAITLCQYKLGNLNKGACGMIA